MSFEGFVWMYPRAKKPTSPLKKKPSEQKLVNVALQWQDFQRATFAFVHVSVVMSARQETPLALLILDTVNGERSGVTCSGIAIPWSADFSTSK